MSKIFTNYNFFRRRDRVEENEKPEVEEEKEKRPRMSGSLIQNPHDDITTRIKNIEYIEIGRHRLRYKLQKISKCYNLFQAVVFLALSIRDDCRR